MKNVIVAITLAVLMIGTAKAQTVKARPGKVNAHTTNVATVQKKDVTPVKKAVPRNKKNMTLTVSRKTMVMSDDMKTLKK